MGQIIDWGRGVGPDKGTDSTACPSTRSRGGSTSAMRGSRLKVVGRKRRETDFVARRAAAVEAVIQRDLGCTFWRHVEAVAHELSEADRLELAKAGECNGRLTAHEPGLRSHGADPTDPAQAVCVCYRHHTFAHAHPRLAQVLGLISYPISHVTEVRS